MKLLHTADWHIGMACAGFGERARAARSARVAAARRALSVGVEEDVAAVLIAGDLFDRVEVDHEDLSAVLALLEAVAPIAVAIVPGNHDPLGPGSVWERSEWAELGEHVHVFRSPDVWQPRPDLEIFGAPIGQKTSRRDPTDWMVPNVSPAGSYRVGLAHGSLEALPRRGNFPIARDRARQARLDYLALGDWHSVWKEGRTAYSGTPEATAFAERDSGRVLLVELASDDEPLLTERSVGRFNWHQVEARLEDITDLEDLIRRMECTGPAEDLVCRLVVELVSGEATLWERWETWVQGLGQRAFHLDLRVEARSVPQVEIPAGLLERVDTLLEQLANGAAHAAVPEADAGAALAARAELRRLVVEAGP